MGLSGFLSGTGFTADAVLSSRHRPALDGTQTAQATHVKASWTYHPDKRTQHRLRNDAVARLNLEGNSLGSARQRASEPRSIALTPPIAGGRRWSRTTLDQA